MPFYPAFRVGKIIIMLGITPAAPGYELARVAPRLGALRRASGSVPTPHGWLSVAVDRDAGRVSVDSPVAFILHLEGQKAERHPPGRKEFACHD